MGLPDIGELKALYDHFNRLYFEEKLPPSSRITLAYSNRLTASAGICYPERRTIRLSAHYHRRHPGEAGATLLHEMIHLLAPRHGAEFKSWLKKIRARGGRVELHARERATASVMRWLYVCRSCGRRHCRRNRLKQGGAFHRCAACLGKLKETRLF